MTKQEFITEFMAHNAIIQPGKELQAQLEQCYTIAEHTYNVISERLGKQEPQSPIEAGIDNILKSELHSAHQKIKRQRKAIKRKAKAYAKLGNEFREYMYNGSNALAEMRMRAEEAQRKADRMQWIAEHVDEAVKQQAEQYKHDCDFDKNAYKLTCEASVTKMRKLSMKVIDTLADYLTTMSVYLSTTEDPDRTNMLNRCNESLANIQSFKDVIEDAAKIK